MDVHEFNKWVSWNFLKYPVFRRCLLNAAHQPPLAVVSDAGFAEQEYFHQYAIIKFRTICEV